MHLLYRSDATSEDLLTGFLHARKLQQELQQLPAGALLPAVEGAASGGVMPAAQAVAGAERAAAAYTAAHSGDFINQLRHHGWLVTSVLIEGEDSVNRVVVTVE